MVTRKEAEEAIRHLALEWVGQSGFTPAPGNYASFRNFTTWLEDQGYGHYLKFRSRIDARSEAEGWFESVVKSWSRRRLELD